MHLGIFFLHFSNPRREYDYIRQPDYLLKYSILLSWCIGVGLIWTELQFNTNSLFIWVPYEIMIILTLILFITWYKTILYWVYGNYSRGYSKFSCWMFHIVEVIQRNLILRVGIYLYIILSYIALVSIMLVSKERVDEGGTVAHNIVYDN